MSDLGISNFEIERIIRESNNEELIKNFVGVFSSEKMDKLMDFQGLMKERSAKYPFLILNTELGLLEHTGEEFWTFTQTQKLRFFFDSLGIRGLKNFRI